MRMYTSVQLQVIKPSFLYISAAEENRQRESESSGRYWQVTESEYVVEVCKRCLVAEWASGWCAQALYPYS